MPLAIILVSLKAISSDGDIPLLIDRHFELRVALPPLAHLRLPTGLTTPVASASPTSGMIIASPEIPYSLSLSSPFNGVSASSTLIRLDMRVNRAYRLNTAAN